MTSDGLSFLLGQISLLNKIEMESTGMLKLDKKVQEGFEGASSKMKTGQLKPRDIKVET
ncbi:hypothetical protein BDP27DRAFT_1431544 [Rhodocollybia butyracea]|uniref:Uncharacterized protein n=1 Tax=Rhodocollybia butyracea TaxID=206335 RepID=A0A9P5P8L4_9AGAR|nr:hypothetical protein BDP27DRAFT_1431544 [Rhodocollybia butyracea]